MHATPLGLDVHLLTVVLRATRIMGSRLGREAERPVLEALREHESAAQRRVATDLGLTAAPGSLVEGDTVEGALSRFDWQDTDVLVLASGRSGAIRRVFIGDMTHRMLRSSSVPTLVLPRHTGDDS
jgi:nucleotide-binding universal stress UspA family protein